MFQPFCNVVEQRVIDDTLHLTIQTRQTIDDVPDKPGFMTDNSVYRHIVMKLTTGELIENYLGPIHL